MTEKEVKTDHLFTPDEQERIAGCYTKTTEYYGELPETCAKCTDFAVCFTLDEQNIVTKEKGGE